MNAAAYKAQIYFDQREALLRYLGIRYWPATRMHR